MGYDPMGTWNWNTFFSGVGLVVMGAAAVASAWYILHCGGAGILMACIASYTIVAGSITVANGTAELVEAATDFNPVRDTIFMGSEEAYEGIKNIFKAHAEIGTMICGAYIAVNGGNVCFVEGTPVSTEAGQIPIEAVVPGMLVWATDPVTGETALKPVVQTFVNYTDELVHVTVNGETITCTNEHPFYSPQRGWLTACQLRAGDVLVMLNGEYVVVEQVQHELLESPVTVYNFEVAEFHTYYVGDTEVLVHNDCKSVKIGQVGEQAAGISSKGKTKILINGRNRIPDKLTKDALIEVKNVKYISNTRQLKDFADYAKLTERQLELYVRPTTKVAQTVIDAGWKIKYLW